MRSNLSSCRRAASRHLAAALALGALAACHAHWDDDDHHHPAPYYDFWELEPNDSHCCPDDLGWVAVGDAFVIGGSIRDDGFDPFDGFELTSVGPCSIRFQLEPLDGVSDLDLCVWDPVLGDFAFCFESSDWIEQGSFNVPFSGSSFHLVVASYAGDSEYRLSVQCVPIGLGLTDQGGGEELGERRAELSSKAQRFGEYGPAEAAEEVEELEVESAVIVDLDLATGEHRVVEVRWTASSPR